MVERKTIYNLTTESKGCRLFFLPSTAWPEHDMGGFVSPPCAHHPPLCITEPRQLRGKYNAGVYIYIYTYIGELRYLLVSPVRALRCHFCGYYYPDSDLKCVCRILPPRGRADKNFHANYRELRPPPFLSPTVSSLAPLGFLRRLYPFYHFTPCNPCGDRILGGDESCVALVDNFNGRLYNVFQVIMVKINNVLFCSFTDYELLTQVRCSYIPYFLNMWLYTFIYLISRLHRSLEMVVVILNVFPVYIINNNNK